MGYYFKSIACAVSSFLAGILIDLDHLVDYYLNYGFTIKVKAIYVACLDMSFDKLRLFFHSYELIALAWLAVYALSLSNIWKAAAIGLTQHLIFDQLVNPIKVKGYFFAYRFMQGFKKDSFITNKGVRR